MHVILTAKVEELVLSLWSSHLQYMPTDFSEFSCQHFIIQIESSIECLHIEEFISLKPPQNFDAFDNLEMLNLNKVDVLGEDIQNLSCLVLAWLSVRHFHQLKNPKTSQSLCRLKYLNIEWCIFLRMIDFYIGNLIT